MELKAQKEALVSYKGRWETRLELPVETEILIPDYQPVVFKIVKCLLQPVILQNRIASGHWMSEGYLRCTVYYQSDEPGCRLWRTEQKIAFEKSVDLPSNSAADGPAQLWGEQEYCNCHAVSERRIDLRGAYVLFASALIINECTALTSLSNCGIEQQTSTISGQQRVAVEERTYTVESEIPRPADGASLLDISGTFQSENIMLQTGQANCRGTLQIQLCVQQAGEEKLSTQYQEIPIQQTVELPGIAENDTCSVYGNVLACTLSSVDGNAKATLSVTWKLYIEVWREVHCAIATDAYSTQFNTQTTHTDCRLLQKEQEIATLLSLKIDDTLPDADMEVKGCFVTLCPLIPTSCGDATTKTSLRGKGIAHILCSDIRGEMTCYDKAFTYGPETAWQSTPGELYTCLRADIKRIESSKTGIELQVDIEVSLCGTVYQVKTVEVLSEVEIEEPFEVEATAPALYLYYAAAGESLFSIAKNYHARVKDIVKINHLEVPSEESEDVLKEAIRLLIPAAR